MQSLLRSSALPPPCCSRSKLQPLHQCPNVLLQPVATASLQPRNADRITARRQASQQAIVPHASRVPPQSAQQPARRDSIDDEIRLQEEEADLSVEDLMQMQYEVPDDEELDVEAREVLEMETGVEQATSSSIQGTVQQLQASENAEDEYEENSDVQTVLPRKQIILLEILAAAATDADLEGKIAEYADEIDDELLDLLQKRINVVSKVGQQVAFPTCLRAQNVT